MVAAGMYGDMPHALAWTLILGSGLFLLCEWRTIGKMLHLDRESIATIEQTVQRLPSHLDVVAANALTVLLLVLSVQFVSKVYAMAFTLSSSTSETNDTRQVIMADFDGDGDLDYVAINNASSSDYYVNNGNGTFTYTSSYDSTGDPFGMAVPGDLNGDGNMDYVVKNVAAVVSKVTGNGQGGFTKGGLANVQPGNGVVIDVDNDGDLDLVGAFSTATAQSVFLNDGHGNFTAAASTLPGASGMVAADFNSDGYQDIAFTNLDLGAKVSVYLNSGTGAFVSSFSTTLANRGSTMTAGDVDGDGDIDLMLTDLISNFYTYTNNGTGTSFTAGTGVPCVIDSLQRLNLGDLDNDGDLDLIAAGNNSGTAGGARVFINDGAGVFTVNGTAMNNTDNTQSIAIGDIDGDGDLDYIRGNKGTQANRHYVSDQAATSANTAPTAPSDGSLSAVIASINNQITTIDSSGNVGSFASVAIPSDGLPIVAYKDDTNNDLKIVKCGNIACTSGNSVTTLDSSGNVGSYATVKIAGDGLPVVAYWDVTNDDLKVAHCGNATCTISNSWSIVDSTAGGSATAPQMAIANDGYPVIAYFGYNFGLKYVKCGNYACSSGNTSGSSYTGVQSPDQSVAIGSDNLPVVVYFDNVGNHVILRHCGNDSCSSGNTDSNISTYTVGSSYESSVVIGNDGYPIVAYSYNDGFVHVIKCGNLTCSSVTTDTEISDRQTGQVPMEMALGTDGNPIVMFNGANAPLNTEAVYVVKCGNAGCTSGNTSTIVDQRTYNTATYIGLAMPTDGRPLVAYNLTSLNDLSFLRCGNASCSSGGSNGLVNIRFSWGSGSDTQTATRLLQYQLRVGTGSNANNVVSGKTASPNWVTRVMPNGQSKTYLVKNQTCRTGLTYYWGVTAVDTGFKRATTSEQSYTLDDSCTLGSGGSGGSSGTPNTVGGGLSRIVLNQPSKTSTDSSVKNAVLSVSAFLDVNSDGEKQTNEQSGFKGLAFTASGSTTDGTKVRKTILLNDRGTNSFDLPPSDTRGYSVLVDTGSEVLKGFESTTDEILTKITLKSGEKKSVSFGFVRSDLLRYKPCLDFGPPEREPVGSSEAAKLLVRLTDSFGVSLTKGLSLKGDLMTRRDFFTLLQRSQCLPLFTDEAKLITALKSAIAGRIALPLIDLPLSLRDADSTLVHSLLALGLRIERMTVKGPGADLASPVTRQEAVLAVFDALNVPKNKLVFTGGTLPVDVDAADPIVTPYLTLQSLGILPSSFLPVFGPTKGLNPDEAATLLARAAFRGGKISLLPVTLDQSAKKKLKGAAKVPTFLSEIPSFKLSSCLEKTTKRAAEFSFTDILPGDPLAADLEELLMRSAKNKDKKSLWLIPGTLRPTEFGVDRGSTRMNPGESVSIIETIRGLLVLSCLPPYTADEMKKKGFEGSPHSKVPRDMISNLPRDTTFPSRTLYRSQDHQREFDLSLFTYAQELLRKDPRPPISPLTLDEASSLLSSALLRIAVAQKNLSPQAAEKKSADLRLAIARDLLGSSLDWRDASVLKRTPFTRAMFLQFLGTVVQNRAYTTPTVTTGVSLGQIWWERVK